MDLSVLPNNNHPEKFLQLDPKFLLTKHGFCQAEQLESAKRHLQDRVSSKGQLMTKSKDRSCPSPDGTPVVSDRNCEKYGTALTLKSNMKSNPLFMASGSLEKMNNTKMKPCWTVKEYNTQTMHWTLANHLKAGERTPTDLEFWLEDLYTPGFDSLLKNKEKKQNRKNLLKYLSIMILCICAILVVIIVPCVVLKKKT